MTRITVPLNSIALRSATYNEDTEELDITFVDGRTFSYDGVPEDVFKSLTEAPSPGRYYHQNIKDQY